MLRRVLIIVPGLWLSSDVLATELWKCEAGNGQRYLSERSVAGDQCTRLDTDPLQVDLPQFDPNTPRPGSDAPSFCKSQKAAVCIENDGPEEFGELKGVRYKLFRDSALVAAAPNADLRDYNTETLWDISCHRDKMTSRRTCSVNKGDFYIFVSQNSKDLISIGNNHYPGSLTSIKIGQRRYDTSDRDGNFSTSSQIIPLLKDGTPVVTRFMRWPYRSWVDDEFTAHGIPPALDLARWLLKYGKID